MSEIIKFNWKISSHIDAMTNLHSTLVPQSHPARLGRIFMSKFYFYVLPRLNLLDGYLCKIKDQYVGFILFTTRPNSFITDGIKAAPMYFSFILINMIIMNPILIFKILNMIFQKKKEKNNIIRESCGKWLTFGVLPEVLKIVDDSGHRISHKLVEKMVSWFKKRGCKKIFAGVRKNNLAAILFYNSLGFEMIKSERDNKFYDFQIRL
tara:strand:+ start:631 stop:1254 length:624 start_codon:yes stop_codon:yes gene_type:complete